MVTALSALAQEHRLEVFRLLVKAGPAGMLAGDIAQQLQVPAPTLSFHLKELSNAGLAVSRQDGRYVIYSANFGNALPVAGALVAGPQVAAALLIFSQIFKKPLQEVSQVYYSIGGTFDEPLIETITAEQFAASGLMTGCIDEAD